MSNSGTSLVILVDPVSITLELSHVIMMILIMVAVVVIRVVTNGTFIFIHVCKE